MNAPNKIIFVTGVMRSGTTLLHRLVSTCKQSNGLSPEIQEPRLLLQDYIQHPEKKNYTEELRNIFTKFWGQQNQPHYLIAKDPMLLGCSKELLSLLPEVQLIIALRDPREVINSIFKVISKLKTQKIVNFLSKMNEFEVIDYVMNELAVVPQIVNKENVLIVRYEDLVSKETTIYKISNFIDCSLVYDISKTIGPFDRDSAFYTAFFDQGISNSRVGKFENLSSDVLNYLESSYSDLLFKIDYT